MSALPPKADITAMHRRVRAISPPIEARSQLIPALVNLSSKLFNKSAGGR